MFDVSVYGDTLGNRRSLGENANLLSAVPGCIPLYRTKQVVVERKYESARGKYHQVSPRIAIIHVMYDGADSFFL